MSEEKAKFWVLETGSVPVEGAEVPSPDFLLKELVVTSATNKMLVVVVCARVTLLEDLTTYLTERYRKVKFSACACVSDLDLILTLVRLMGGRTPSVKINKPPRKSQKKDLAPDLVEEPKKKEDVFEEVRKQLDVVEKKLDGVKQKFWQLEP